MASWLFLKHEDLLTCSVVVADILRSSRQLKVKAEVLAGVAVSGMSCGGLGGGLVTQGAEQLLPAVILPGAARNGVSKCLLRHRRAWFHSAGTDATMFLFEKLLLFTLHSGENQKNAGINIGRPARTLPGTFCEGSSDLSPAHFLLAAGFPPSHL